MVDINIDMSETKTTKTLPHYKNPNYQKEYRATHREQKNAYMKEYNKIYYQKNKEHILKRVLTRRRAQKQTPAPAPVPAPAPAPAPASLTINITRGTESIIIHF
jgi:hypothetical protein